MSQLTILTVPDPRLTKVADPITCVTDDIRQLMDDMLETMYANEGMGLAATQVGVLKRIIVIDLNAGEEDLPPTPLKMVNPEILWQSEETSHLVEACLSVPYQRGDVERPSRVKIRYMDEHNVTHEIDADGIMATCVQHEIDHLNGILFVDKIEKVEKY